MAAVELAVVIDPGDWRRHAVCRGMELDVFFPSPGDDLAIAKARTICFSCPVRLQCLEDAHVRRERDGVRGGEFLEDYRRPRPHVVVCTRCDSSDLFRWNGKIECGACGFTWVG